ncbi:MAG: BatA domain-containing protein [Cyclobacteriaceae bacterium]
MTFINPSALWGLFLVAIPIIIHLFNFRRVKKLFFSNVSFLTSVKSQSNSKNTLKKLLVLLLRILALIFLVIAFAQPMLIEERKGVVEVEKSKVYFLDNSLSMGRKSSGQGDLIGDGIMLLKSLVLMKSDNRSFGLISNDFDAANRSILARELEDKLAEIDLYNKGRDIASVVAKCNRVGDGQPEIILISDFQKKPFDNLSSVLEDSINTYRLLKLEAGSENNLFVDSVVLDNPIGLPTKNELMVRISNSGNQNRKDILVKVFQNEVQISSFTEGFNRYSSKWVSIDLSENSDLSGRYTIEVVDSEFAYDNRFYFAIEQFDRSKIYHIYDEKENEFIRSVYANDDFFSLNSSTIRNIDQERLMKADLVILDHLEEIPNWLIGQLSVFKNSILVMPNESFDYVSYSAFLNIEVGTSKKTSKYGIKEESLRHPYFNEVFNENQKESNMPWVNSVMDLSRSSEVILKSSVGDATLAVAREGVFAFSHPLSKDYTNLHKHGLFLPLMYKLAFSNRKSPVLSYSIEDRFIPLRNDSIYSYGGGLKLVSGEQVLVPQLRNIDGEFSLEIPSVLHEPGFYELRVNDNQIRTLAFNLSKIESDLASFSNEEIEKMVEGRSNVYFQSIDDVGTYTEELNQSNEALPLWKYALLLTLIFLIAELTLLRLFR